MLTDLRLALRHLLKARGFAFISILTLAIGIGASTAMFSTLRALVVHPFDFPESHELAHVWSGDGWPLSPMDYKDIHEQNTSFEDLGAYQPGSVNVGAENAQAVQGIRSTYGVLHAFGVQPQQGRLFRPEDDVKASPPVAIISHDLWQQTFGGDPNLLGNTARIDGRNATVVGIMPADFEFAGPWVRTANIQVWQPYPLEDQNDRGSHWLNGIGRLKDGVTVGQADAEIKAMGIRFAELYPDSNTHKKFLVRSLKFEMTKDLGEQVWLLFGAVALVLLVACANVASMLLARSAQRQGEFGVRVALGATRTQLIRLALTESLVLASVGALVGLAFAFGGIEVLKVIAPTSEARKAAISLDGIAVLFALGATVLTALLAGLPPALAAARTSLSGIIRSDARGAVGSRSRQIMLRALIIGQIAVAFVLANGAAMFSASYLKILAENEALSTNLVLSAKLNLNGESFLENEDRVKFWEELSRELGTVPGVTAVGLTSKLPLEGGSNTSALVNDEVYDPTAQRMNVERSSVTPEYFEAMGMKITRGRNLMSQDDMSEDGHLGVVVNQAMVAKAWPDKDPIGEIFRANQAEDPWYTATVVGVTENVRQWGATADPRPEMFTTPPGHWGRTIFINLRSTQSAEFLTPMLRETVRSMNPELALENNRTLNQVVRDATASERAMAGLVDFFMITALGLVAVGLYGTLSYHIAQRTREIGVRLAIGALAGDIQKLVFNQGLRWVGIGVLLGLGGTFALGSVLESIVYGMDGITALPLILSTLTVGAAATIAIWLPARRASRLNPIEALRID